MISDSPATIFWLALVVVLAPLLARFLRGSRDWPAAGTVAGLIIGSVLGLSIAGRLDRVRYEQTVLGGMAERQALESARSEAGAYRAARSTLSPSPDADDPVARAHAQKEEACLSAWKLAQQRHQAPARLLLLILTGAMLACIRSKTTLLPSPARGAWLHVLIWGALLPAAVVVVLLRLYGTAPHPSLCAAVACSAALLSRQATTSRGASLAADALLIAGLLASAALLVRIPESGQGAVRAPLAPIITISAALMIRPLVSLSRASSSLDRVARRVILPGVLALALTHVDVLSDLRLGVLLTLLIAAGDGRAAGLALGRMVQFGERWREALGQALASLDAAAVQIAFAALFIGAGALDRPLVLGVLFAAVLFDWSEGIRAATARWCEEK